MRKARVLTGLVLALAAATLLVAANAQAHVTVSAPGATRGAGDQVITFRVPVEKQSDTVRLTIALPTDRPIASVLVEPMAGWSHTQQTVRLAKPIHTDDGDITTAVSQITWSALPGHGLKPGEFGSFTILAGQLPDAPSVTFRALQTYADGSVVRWNEVAAPGSTDEPTNPAPVLHLAVRTHQTPPVTHSTSSDTVPLILAIIALVIGVAALVVAALGRRTRRGGRL